MLVKNPSHIGEPLNVTQGCPVPCEISLLVTTGTVTKIYTRAKGQVETTSKK